MFKIFFLPFILCAVIPVQALEINLTFGSYFNDHAKRKFVSNERHWKLNGKHLEYHINAHQKKYTNKLKVTDEEFKKINHFIKKKKLLRSIHKKLKTGMLNKHEYNEVIRGNINLNNIVVKILIKANGHGLIESDSKGKFLYELEKILYQIIKNHK